MNRLQLEIITPERVLVQQEVDMVEARGTYGEFGILPGHTQFLSTIEIGELRYSVDGQTVSLSTGGGIAEIVEDKALFLLDSSEFAEEIDVDRARRAMERAQTMIKTLTMDQKEYRLQEMALLRAIARISVASKKI